MVISISKVSAGPSHPLSSGERIRYPSHYLGFWRTHQVSLTLPGLLENQSTMDFKVKSMLLGYVNLKISKWYASLRCPTLSKA